MKLLMYLHDKSELWENISTFGSSKILNIQYKIIGTYRLINIFDY